MEYQLCEDNVFSADGIVFLALLQVGPNMLLIRSIQRAVTRCTAGDSIYSLFIGGSKYVVNTSYSKCSNMVYLYRAAAFAPYLTCMRSDIIQENTPSLIHAVLRCHEGTVLAQ